MTTESQLKLDKTEAIATLILNRPDALNAFNTALLHELRTRLHELSGDPAVRAVIITGTGDRAFCAGADIREMSDKSPWEGREFARLGHEVMASIERLDKPVIAAINGLALEVDLFGLCFASVDQKEGMAAFLGKRTPEYQRR